MRAEPLMPDAEPSVTQGGRQKKRDLGLACELAPRDGFEHWFQLVFISSAFLIFVYYIQYFMIFIP